MNDGDSTLIPVGALTGEDPRSQTPGWDLLGIILVFGAPLLLLVMVCIALFM